MKYFKTSEHTTDSARPLDKRSLFSSLAAGIATSAILLSGSFMSINDVRVKNKLQLSRMRKLRCQ